MKKYVLKFTLLCGLFLCFTSVLFGQEPDKHQVLTDVIMHTLMNWHYSAPKIDNQFSHQVYSLYLKHLDPNKRILLKSDLSNLQRYQSLIDDDLNQNKDNFYQYVNILYNKRVSDVQNIVQELLKKPVNLTVEESLEIDPEKRDFPANNTELTDLWRKTIKYQILQRYEELLANREKDGVKLSVEQKNMVQPDLEQQAQSFVARSMKRTFDRILGESDSDRFNRYLNAVVGAFDPHTEYFSPEGKEDFDIQLNGTVQGIGVIISEDGDNIKAEEIVAGSPAWRQKELQPGDIILKVAQGAGEPVDVTNMKSSDVVKLIRGKKGTEVRLTVQKPDGRILVIPIIRDIVVIEESYAHSVIINNEKNTKKIGYIDLPGFYHDEKTNRSSANDVKQELQDMKSEKVDGIILDLRNNGGGYLEDAINLAGLFIGKGPILQVKNRMSGQEILNDTDSGLTYNGPVVVLINSLSASASEIVAAALQDYGRAVIVGGPSSFGKGSVQTFVDLDQLLSNNMAYLKPMGSLKLTIQKFYRINGDSTQFKGVSADIPLPDVNKYLKIGERTLDYPLPWDSISTAPYQKWTQGLDLTSLKKNSALRVKSLNSFKTVNDSIALIEQEQKNTLAPLKLARFLATSTQRKLTADKIKNLQTVLPYLKAVIPQAESSVASQTKQEWQKQVTGDSYIGEASFVLGDMLHK